jgi:hypothetical protein
MWERALEGKRILLTEDDVRGGEVSVECGGVLVYTGGRVCAS